MLLQDKWWHRQRAKLSPRRNEEAGKEFEQHETRGLDRNDHPLQHQDHEIADRIATGRDAADIAFATTLWDACISATTAEDRPA